MKKLIIFPVEYALSWGHWNIRNISLLQKCLEELFPSWYHVKRYEEVLLFTCGMTSDPRSLIEHVGKMLVERETRMVRVGDDERETQLDTMGKSALLLNLMRSLYAEVNLRLESKPHHNRMFNIYSHEQDDMCGRARDTTPIEIPSQLYGFECLQEYAPQYNIKNSGKIYKNCVVRIVEVPCSVANSLLLTCREISQNQPITDLCIDGLYCDKSHPVPADVFNLSKTAQSITIKNSILPCDLMEHLISQLPQCKQLRKLHLEDITLYIPQSKQTSKEELSVTKMSAASSKTQNQLSKWGLEFQTSNQSHGNSLLSGDTFLFLSKCRMITHLNLNGSKVGKAGIHIVQMINRLGLNPPLQLLYLRDCSIPTDTLQEILKSLQKCKQLTHLDLGGHSLEKDGENLVELIKSFQVDSPLQQLCLLNCSIQEVNCTEMLKYLSDHRHLTHLILNGNRVGKGGMHIVQMVERLGKESPLQLLDLRDCSIPTDTLREILKSLQKCKQLTHLDLGGHSLEKDGENLVELIKSFQVDSPLQQLCLQNCSIQEVNCTEMLKYLSDHRHLTHLNLNGNRVGKGGIHIVQMVERLGKESPLQLLYLRDCSIPTDTLREILKSLQKCKQLTHLDLGGHSLEKDGENLVELIKSFQVDSPLQQLYLPNCSIQEVNCTEMLKYLSDQRHLTHLNLNGNRVGKGGIHIVQMVERLGKESPLQLLYLRDCSIPTDTLREILKSLQKCKQLTHLDLGGHSLEKDGENLVELIKSFQVDSPLQQLYLPNCSIQEVNCTEMLKYLSDQRHLTHLNLNGNRVGKGGIHIVQMVERLGKESPLQLLYLRDCSIPTDTLREILKSLQKCKQLTHLDLGGHSLEKDGENLVELIENVGKDPGLQQLGLLNCLLSEMEVTELVTHLSAHRQLVALDLSGNNLGNAVHRLIGHTSIQTLQLLYLANTNMAGDGCERLLRTLNKYENLIYLNLGENNLTGQLSHFLSDAGSALPCLRQLVLINVGLNKDDVNHLKTLIEFGRMPALGGPDNTDKISLNTNNWQRWWMNLRAYWVHV